MPFGVTETGFERKTLEDILTGFEDRQRADIDPNIDVSAETPLGQLNGIYAAELAEAWEGLEGAYHSYNPNAAEGDAMVNVALITGTEKRPAQPSRVTCTLSIEAGDTVPAGSLISLDTREDIQFVLLSDAVNPSGITADIAGVFECTVDGPTQALAGNLTNIVTPHSGWLSVTNALDAELGRFADDTITLRQRRQQQLALRGGSTIDAIQADLLELDTIDQVEPLENTKSEFDPITGLPGRSFEFIILDGSLTDDNTIAQTIFNSRPAGMISFGNTSGTAVDGEGDSHTVKFSRPIEVLLYVKMSVRVTSLFPPVDGDEQVKAAVVARARQVFTVGDDITPLPLAVGAFNVPGVVDVPIESLKIGLTSNPPLNIPIGIGLHEIARFDTSRVEVEIL